MVTVRLHVKYEKSVSRYSLRPLVNLKKYHQYHFTLLLTLNRGLPKLTLRALVPFLNALLFISFEVENERHPKAHNVA